MRAGRPASMAAASTAPSNNSGLTTWEQLKPDRGTHVLTSDGRFKGLVLQDRKRFHLRTKLRIPAAVRFLSMEPLLAPVNLAGIWGYPDSDDWARTGSPIGWVIVGGESGPGARPCSLAWIRDIVEQCRDAEVPVFVKQMGANPVWSDSAEDQRYCLSDRDPKGGDWPRWPEDLRVREMPQTHEVPV